MGLANRHIIVWWMRTFPCWFPGKAYSFSVFCKIHMPSIWFWIRCRSESYWPLLDMELKPELQASVDGNDWGLDPKLPEKFWVLMIRASMSFSSLTCFIGLENTPLFCRRKLTPFHFAWQHRPQWPQFGWLIRWHLDDPQGSNQPFQPLYWRWWVRCLEHLGPSQLFLCLWMPLCQMLAEVLWCGWVLVLQSQMRVWPNAGLNRR